LDYIDLSNFDTSKTISISHMFSGCSSLYDINIQSFDTSLITSMEYLFAGCSSLSNITLNFDTTNVINMGHMFSGCSKLNFININSFNIVNVKSMEYMFSDCTSLVDIDLYNFDGTSLENLSHMFYGCTLLETVNMSNLSAPNIKDIDYMFYNCINLGYINFEKFNFSNYIKYINMFSGTPENMVFCIPESNVLLEEIVTKKGCSVINCSEDWTESRELVLAKNNKCVKKCLRIERFLFKYKCYDRCPKGTYPYGNLCTFDLHNEEGACDIRNMFLNNCNKTFNSTFEKQVFIEDIIKGILTGEFYDIVLNALDNNNIFTIKYEHEVYQIYSSNNKIREPDLVYIDLDYCINTLKSIYRLDENENILVFKIEYYSPDFKIPIVEYILFAKTGYMRLNQNLCKGQKIYYYIPKKINDFEDYKYNPNNNYYFDKCQFSSISNNVADLSLWDRMNEFNNNNMSLCESHCIFKGYINQEIVCDCKVKYKLNSYLNNIDYYDLIHRFYDIQEDISNLWVFKCFFVILKKEYLLYNIGFYIIFSNIIIMIIGIFIYKYKDYNILLEKIDALINMTYKERKRKKFKKKNIVKIIKMQRNINNIKKSIKNSDSKRKAKTKTKGNCSVIFKSNERLTEIPTTKNMYEEINDFESIKKKTDYEMNFLEYEDAAKLDNRTFFEYYLSLIKQKNIILFTFFQKVDYNSKIIKICFLCLIFVLILVVNTLFINDKTFHNLFVLKGSFDVAFHIPNIMQSTIVCYFLKKIFHWLIFTEMDILKIRNNDGVNKSIKLSNMYITIYLKCILFFTISIFFLLLFWIYITCFCAIFKHTQLFIIKITFISFSIFLIIPFITNIIPSIFRIKSLQKVENNDKEIKESSTLYKISKIIQVIA
jgi:surface protein